MDTACEHSWAHIADRLLAIFEGIAPNQHVDVVSG
jgi:hypothetical protein